VSKAVVDSALGGEPERVETYGARFTGHVFPGETLVTRVWREGDDRLILTAEAMERGTTVLANAAITVRN
jgi:3-hydroxyacyl-CoA dehydrogenase/3a,7a,12a-trihydroxy-5b-cholest-24-enoyl-CoA hydratase